MMTPNHRLGSWGEGLARLFLEQCGYECLASRWRRPGGELDLVMRRRGLVVFVEVKTRGPGALVDPEACVDHRKLAHMRRIARCWLAENPGQAPRGCRFDVVAIRMQEPGEGGDLLHLAGVG